MKLFQTGLFCVLVLGLCSQVLAEVGLQGWHCPVRLEAAPVASRDSPLPEMSHE